MASAVAASIFGGASSAVMIAFINSAIAEPLPLGSKWLYLFIVITLTVLISRLASEFLLINLSQKAIYELRMALCQQILSTGLRKLEEIGAAKLLVVLTDDITVITHAMMDIPTICVSFMMFVVSFIYLAWLSTKLLIFVLLFVLSGVTFYYLLQRRGLSTFFLAREEEDTLFKHFRALLEGSKELKINKEREEIFINKFLDQTSLLLKKHNSSSLRVFATANVLAIILFYLLVGCLLLLFPHFISVERSVLTGYIFVVLFMLGPLGHFLAAIPNIGRANIVLNKISSLGILTPHKLIPDTLNIQNWRYLELVSITHSYYREDEGRCFTLGPVDLTFNRGEIVFLVGGNGSGKTTLSRLFEALPDGQHAEFSSLKYSVTDSGTNYTQGA
ncbi:MAG: ATP-binding cassette domain-containing protein, partial [Blastocatellia bacterium]|nr:ATP-binding cassette domain-containing protein [Blastocatellia bacterium]